MAELLAAPMLAAFRRLVRRGLAGVWTRGQLPVGPVVWAANHHSWWDPFLAAALVTGAGRRPGLLMRQDNLARFGFLSHVGVLGTGQFRRGLDMLRAGRVLVVYPEAELRPVGAPGPLAAGAAWYATRAPARLCAVAVRVLLRGEQFPEAYLTFTEIDTHGSTQRVTGRLRSRLTQDLADLDELNAVAEPRRPLPGFDLMLRGRRGWDQRLRTPGRVPWPRR